MSSKILFLLFCFYITTIECGLISRIPHYLDKPVTDIVNKRVYKHSYYNLPPNAPEEEKAKHYISYVNTRGKSIHNVDFLDKNDKIIANRKWDMDEDGFTVTFFERINTVDRYKYTHSKTNEDDIKIVVDKPNREPKPQKKGKLVAVGEQKNKKKGQLMIGDSSNSKGKNTK